MARKFAIELEDEIHQKLMKIYQEDKRLNSEVSFEQFLSEIISQYVVIKNKTSDLFSKSFKSMLDNFDPSQLDDILSSMKNMGDMFGGNSEDKKTEESKKTEETPQADQPKKKS